MPFNNPKASQKLYLLVLVLSFFIIGIGMYGVSEMKTMKQNSRTLYADRLVPLQQLTTIRFSYSAGILSSTEQVHVSRLDFEEAINRVTEAEKNIADNWKQYMTTYLTQEEELLAKKTFVLITQSTSTIRQLKAVLRSGNIKRLDSLVKTELYPAINPILENLSELINLQVSVGSNINEHSTEVYDRASLKFYLFIAIALFLAVCLSFYIIKNVNNLIKSLRESEKKYRSIFENVQDVFFQANLAGTVLDISPSIMAHTGFSREELIGKNVSAIYYNPDDREKGIAILKELGSLNDYELRLKSSSGERVHMLLNARLIKDANGALSHIDGMFKNITERKLIEDQLAEQKEQMALFIEHSPASLAMFSNDMHYIATSRKWKEENAVAKQSLIGRSHYEIYPDLPEHWIDAHQHCLEGNVAKCEEDIFVRADGTKHWVKWEIRPWHKASGDIGGIIMFTEDITERKNATELFKQQFENSPDIILIINRDFKIESINHGLPGGPPTNELVGVNSVEILPIESREPARKAIMACFETGINQEIENTLRNGSWVKSRFVPIVFHGSIQHIMIIATDITQRKTAELERMKMTNELLQRNKDLKQFSYVVSHNLRAPLANIMGISNLINSAQIKPDEEKQMIGHLATSVEKLDNVIRDLNHILQVRHDVGEQKEDVQLDQLLADIQLSIDHLLQKEGVRFITDFTQVQNMHTIKSYLHSMFYNLIYNSIKYRQPNMAPVIEITARKLENNIELVFKDNGLGIDMEKWGDDVFGLYKSFHAHTRGKGMGLYMLKVQVESLGGNVSVISKVNQGTRIRIELPIVEIPSSI
jgi:PAS domain S-box-containing protein